MEKNNFLEFRIKDLVFLLTVENISDLPKRCITVLVEYDILLKGPRHCGT